MRKLVLVLGIVAAITVLAPEAALAHDELTNSSPQAGAITPSPEVVTLTFSSAVSTDTCFMRLSSANGESFDVRPTTNGDAQIVSFAIDRELSAGSWNVEWRVLPSDGHPAAGIYSFTVGTGAAVTPVSANVKPVESTGGAPLGILLVLALTLLVGVSAGVLYHRRAQTK